MDMSSCVSVANEGSSTSACKILRGVYTERSECAQDDKPGHSPALSSLPTPRQGVPAPPQPPCASARQGSAGGEPRAPSHRKTSSQTSAPETGRGCRLSRGEPACPERRAAPCTTT